MRSDDPIIWGWNKNAGIFPFSPTLCTCVAAQVAKLDRGHTYLQKFPGAPRRALPLKPVQKAQKFPARNPANGAKRPRNFRRHRRRKPPPDVPTHIQYVSAAPFCNLVLSAHDFHPGPSSPPHHRILRASSFATNFLCERDPTARARSVSPRQDVEGHDLRLL